ncbi:MAG: hypothetical protein CL930_06650 [Deltaproteobacteria bacterium]|nr:hypothetical protein [Deltaproteobacteria bacterium]
MMQILPILCSLFSAPAHAEPTALMRSHGYVSPEFRAIFRPDAKPIDQQRIGMDKSKAGLILDGRVSPPWTFRVHFVLGGDTFGAITTASPVDVDNNGTTDAIYTETAPAISSMVVESTVTYRPVDAFNLRLGQMRIPFTSQAQSPNTDLMFPERAGPNEVFLRGSDLGVLAETNLWDERVLGSIGTFNGANAGLYGNTHGVLYTARIDLNPLGSFGFSETSEWAGPFRFGVGSGIIYNPYTAYDSAGYPTVSIADSRLSASGRIAFYGLYVVGEYLYRQELDSQSSRPDKATGWYGQAGWHLPKGFEPMFRMGETTNDQGFDPRKTVWLDAGLNIYPAAKARRSDQVKLTVHYLSENRIDEGEHAQGVSSRVQVRW